MDWMPIKSSPFFTLRGGKKWAEMMRKRQVTVLTPVQKLQEERVKGRAAPRYAKEKGPMEGVRKGNA